MNKQLFDWLFIAKLDEAYSVMLTIDSTNQNIY